MWHNCNRPSDSTALLKYVVRNLTLSLKTKCLSSNSASILICTSSHMCVRSVTIKQLRPETSDGIVNLMGSSRATMYTTVLLHYVHTEKAAKINPLGATTMRWDIWHADILARLRDQKQEPIKFSRYFFQGNNNATFRTTIKAIHRDDALSEQVSLRGEILAAPGLFITWKKIKKKGE
jgi:hypothetical protein